MPTRSKKKRPATAPRPKSPALTVAGAMESIVGCKWSLHVLGAIRRGVNRPGALERDLEGISQKVLNERLTKLLRFGIVERIAHPEIPPRVEYRLSSLGERFVGLLDEIDKLQLELDGKGSEG